MGPPASTVLCCAVPVCLSVCLNLSVFACTCTALLIPPLLVRTPLPSKCMYKAPLQLIFAGARRPAHRSRPKAAGADLTHYRHPLCQHLLGVAAEVPVPGQ